MQFTFAAVTSRPSIHISECDFCDRRPESPLWPKMYDMASLVLPRNHTGKIEIINHKDECVVLWARGQAWGATLDLIVKASNTREVRVSDGLAKIWQR